MERELRLSVGHCTDKGRKKENQDFLGYRIPKKPLLNIKGAAFAMADGISSSDLSQIASETSVTSFLEDYFCTSDTWSAKASVERVLLATNSWLHAQSMHSEYRHDKDKGYVCTFSAVVLKNRTAHVFHVGDTRVYRLNQSGLEQLTHDHRLWVAEDKSYLSRALGAAEQCTFDCLDVEFKAQDIFILATDGVYEYVSAKEIIRHIEQCEGDLERAASSIVAQAYAADSADNLSLMIVRVDELPVEETRALNIHAGELDLPPALNSRKDFDDYRILRELHSGTRSHVYLAQDLSTQKHVVLKIPGTDVSVDEDALERFLMEEWIARRVNSHYVLKSDLPDRKRNFLYTVFEYVEGQTLAQWAIDNPRPSVEVVRNIIEQVAKGLHAFHRLEILHQDLRPENIMMGAQNTVKIIDFGSVYVAGLEESYPKIPDSYLLGTALYSAPEYFLGLPGTVKSDIFSLAVVCYFLLSGRYPYDTQVPKAKTAIAQKKLRYHSVLSDDREIPAWIDTSLRKALHPMPSRRYDEIFEFIHDLRQPSQAFYKQDRAPLVERNPVAFWRGLSLVLAGVIVLLLVSRSLVLSPFS